MLFKVFRNALALLGLASAAYAAPQPVYDPGAPPPGYGDPGWMRACASKYRSFQWSGPHAGQFQGFDGGWHWCNL